MVVVVLSCHKPMDYDECLLSEACASKVVRDDHAGVQAVLCEVQ